MPVLGVELLTVIEERLPHVGTSGMSASLTAIAPNLVRMFRRGDRLPTGPAADLRSLLDRIRQRLYPESLPVLASWWLRTVYTAGHNRAWWGKLDTELRKALRSQSLYGPAAEAVRDIQTWVRQSVLPRHKAPEAHSLLTPPFRPDLAPDQAAPCLSRILNEWLPGEVARDLTSEAVFPAVGESGMPALTVAKLLERVLLREHYSPASLELLFESEWFSPQFAYPADVEIFRDVVLALLGRTAAPRPPVLPATPLAGGFADAVARASLISSAGGEELHVPVDEAQAMDLIHRDPVRIGSIVVTMDGRWWQSVGLLSGPESVIVYRPGERLRIDFSSQHARLVVPWPDAGARWQGAVHLPDQIALFGREWHARALERSADRTWLHLEFSRTLMLPQSLASEDSRPSHLRPAAIEMAWSEVEQALAAGASESIDRLHRGDLIPLAHALERLVNCLLRPWPPSRADVERCVVSVRYLHGAVASVYGPIPWRVLSPPARAALLKRRGDPVLSGLFAETFDGAPPVRRSPHAA